MWGGGGEKGGGGPEDEGARDGKGWEVVGGGSKGGLRSTVENHCSASPEVGHPDCIPVRVATATQLEPSHPTEGARL